MLERVEFVKLIWRDDEVRCCAWRRIVSRRRRDWMLDVMRTELWQFGIVGVKLWVIELGRLDVSSSGRCCM